uniref:ShKT domain-containing protein n=1 Tax=Steinernema glaseri TaxID=37863 RepID=A0A1I7Y4J3_9BILA
MASSLVQTKSACIKVSERAYPLNGKMWQPVVLLLVIAVVTPVLAALGISKSYECIFFTNPSVCINDQCGPGLMCDQETKTCEQCKDRIPWCEKNKGHCKHHVYEKFLADRCPATCGVCEVNTLSPIEEVECVDKSRHCSRNVHNCENPKFKKFLEEKCPMTCHICKPRVTQTDQCSDFWGSDMCEQLKLQGLCTSFIALPGEAGVKELCGITCGCCDGQPCGPEELVVPSGRLVEPPVDSPMPPMKPVIRPPFPDYVKPMGPPREVIPECGDNFRGKGSCALFKKKGYCEKIGFYGIDSIRKYCGKTCGLC